jgi:hypothetical protein
MLETQAAQMAMSLPFHGVPSARWQYAEELAQAKLSTASSGLFEQRLSVPKIDRMDIFSTKCNGNGHPIGATTFAHPQPMTGWAQHAPKPFQLHPAPLSPPLSTMFASSLENYQPLEQGLTFLPTSPRPASILPALGPSKAMVQALCVFGAESPKEEFGM